MDGKMNSVLLICLSVIVSASSLASCHQLPMEVQQPSASYYSQQHHNHNPYSYGYDIEDNYGNKQWKQEKSHNPMEVHGNYGYRDNNGIYREVFYVADKNGFRATIKTNEPGLAGTKDAAGVKMESHPASYPSSPIQASQPAIAHHPPIGEYQYYDR